MDDNEPADASALLQRIAHGQTRALEAFYAAFHAPVYAFALKRVRNAADAAEILNEVFLEVWRSAGRFEGRSRPLTWVFGIAHHKIVDHLRRQHADREEELSPDMADPDPTDFSAALAGVQDADLVRRCLERLSGSHRLIVHLAFYQDLSYSEIAEIAACPVGTVKTRMFHAKQSLKRCLGAGTRTSDDMAGLHIDV
jgi:RNA polymerase sigma-70 factor, ECF subfamily